MKKKIDKNLLNGNDIKTYKKYTHKGTWNKMKIMIMEPETIES
jgi:hypothetical protein